MVRHLPKTLDLASHLFAVRLHVQYVQKYRSSKSVAFHVEHNRDDNKRWEQTCAAVDP